MTVTSCQKVPLAILPAHMMNKSCFNYTKIKHDCKQKIAGHRIPFGWTAGGLEIRLLLLAVPLDEV
jgi:hypothetical protein